MISTSLQIALLASMQLAPLESTPLKSPPAQSVLTQPAVPRFGEPTPAPPRSLPQSAAPATPIEAVKPDGKVVPAGAEVAISSLSSSGCRVKSST